MIKQLLAVLLCVGVVFGQISSYPGASGGGLPGTISDTSAISTFPDYHTVVNRNSFPSSSFHTYTNHLAAIVGAALQQSGDTSFVPIGLVGYGLTQKTGNSAFGEWTAGLAGANNTHVWGGNHNASNGLCKSPQQGCTNYTGVFLIALEPDTFNFGASGSVFRANVTAFVGDGSNAMASSGADYGFYAAHPANSLGTRVFSGSGLNDLTEGASTFTGPGPFRPGDTYGLCWWIDAAAGTDTYKWGIHSGAAANCTTGADGDASAGSSKFSSASHYFTTSEVGGTFRVEIFGSVAGCTNGTYTLASVASGVATFTGSPGSGTGCIFRLWQATGVSAENTNTPDLLPAETDNSTTLGSTPYRPAQTSYGHYHVFGATTGHTLNDHWFVSIAAVPYMNYAFYINSGTAVHGFVAGVANEGPSQPSHEFSVIANDPASTARQGDWFASPVTSGMQHNFSWPSATGSGMRWFAGTNCRYTACTNVAQLMNTGDLFLAGQVYQVPPLPSSISNTNGLAIISASTGTCTLGSDTTSGNCFVNAVILRSGNGASKTDTTDTATHIVAFLNTNSATGGCRPSMQFNFRYRNVGATNAITVAADASVTFSPAGSISVATVSELDMLGVVTSCSSPAVTMFKLRNSTF